MVEFSMKKRERKRKGEREGKGRRQEGTENKNNLYCKIFLFSQVE